MSLMSLYSRHTLPQGVTVDNATARAVLAALPRTSVLPDADHDDTRAVASWVALCKHADGMPILDAVAYAWTAARDESIRDAARAAIPADNDADSFAALVEALPDRTTLPRAATYSPEAPYAWTVSDTVTVALSLLDDNARALVDLVLSAPEEAYGQGTGRAGLPSGAWLCSAAALSGLLPDGTDPQSRAGRRLLADTRAAIAALREACAVVESWSANVRARDYWTDNARTLADALADAVAATLDARGTRSATGTATSGPASPVVVRYRDTLSDAWQVVVRTETETEIEIDPETETVSEIEIETTTRTLYALSEIDAAAMLAEPYALSAYSRTRTTREADAYAERLGRTAGAARKSRSRKGSRVGSTGPTVPVGSRSGSGGAPLGLALGTFTVHPVTPIPHPVTVRDAATEMRLAERMADAARLAARDAALMSDPLHVARVESATDRARAAARALAATDSRAPHPVAPVYGPSRAAWETHKARA